MTERRFNTFVILPDLPGQLPEFIGSPPTLQGVTVVSVPSDTRQLSFRDWINHLRNNQDMRDASEILQWNANGRLVGFGSGGKKVFRDIATYLRRLHMANMFSGDLVNRVFIILPVNTVHFSCLPLRATDLGISTEAGIRNDLIHFRFLVGMLMNRLLKADPRYRSFVPLPIDFKLFFSGIFASLNVQEASSFQLLHPLFYDQKQQIDMMRTIAKYRKQNSAIFDKHVNLEESHYKLANWVKRVPNDSPYSAILETAWSKRKGPSHGKIVNNLLIPSYLRNVIEHYRDEGGTDYAYFQSLNYQLPGICSICLDAIIRGAVDTYLDLSTSESFKTMLEEHLGIYLESYRPIPLPPDGDGGIRDGDYDDHRAPRHPPPPRIGVGSSGVKSFASWFNQVP